MWLPVVPYVALFCHYLFLISAFFLCHRKVMLVIASFSGYLHIQSTLVISNPLISNNRLSQSENLVPVLKQRSTNRQQNIVKKRNCSLGAISPLFHNIFNLSVT